MLLIDARIEIKYLDRNIVLYKTSLFNASDTIARITLPSHHIVNLPFGAYGNPLGVDTVLPHLSVAIAHTTVPGVDVFPEELVFDEGHDLDSLLGFAGESELGISTGSLEPGNIIPESHLTPDSRDC